MARARYVALAALMAALSFYPTVAGNPDQAEQGAQWRPLFNGKDLAGWYTFFQKHGRDSDPDRVITIEDGVIHAYKHASHGSEVVMGYMGTDQEFSDYHFRLRYKWGRKQFYPRFIHKPDSGVYYHHVTEDRVWPQALQFQVELHDTGDLLTAGFIKVDTTIDPSNHSELWQQFLPKDRGGVPYTTKVGGGVAYTRRLENHEVDGWNTIDLIVKGDSAVHVVNGQLVNRCTNIRHRDPADPDKWLPLTKGRILVEFEATEIFFKDIQIRQLSPAETIDEAVHSAARDFKSSSP